MIDPRLVMLMTPTRSGKLHAAYVMGLAHVIAQQQVGEPFFLSSCSDPGRARDLCVHAFLKTRYEQLVFVDDDMGFTLQDWLYLLEDQGEDAVSTEAAKKNPAGYECARMGLAFTRLSRRLLLAMAELKGESGDWVAQRFFENGEEYVHYFPSGVSFEGALKSEDHGFWMLAGMARARIRIDRRIALVHYGDYPYQYIRDADKPDVEFLEPPPLLSPEDANAQSQPSSLWDI